MSIAGFLRRPVVLFFIILALGGSYFYFWGSGRTTAETVTVRRGTIAEEVTLTGEVVPVEEVNLAFEKIGEVIRAHVKVGDGVKAGEVLVELDRRELEAELRETQAKLAAEKAKLLELERGTRPEEVQVQEAKVKEAEAALEETGRNLTSAIREAYTKSDDAIRSKVDQFFIDPQSSGPQFILTIPNTALADELERRRAALEGILTAWRATLETISFSETKEDIDTVQSFLDLAASALSSTSQPQVSQTTIEKYRSDVATARTNVNGAAGGLVGAEEKRRNAESNLLVAQKELLLKQAGATPEELATQNAVLSQFEAKIELIKTQIGKTVLRSPLRGIVTKKDAEVGEIVSANSPIVSVISDDQLEIETNVPEVDIVKIKVGDRARLTLDAYGPEVIFEANVVEIEPGETVIEGVTTYKTTLQFEKSDQSLRPRMTANIEIVTNKKDNVLLVPQRAVLTKNGAKFVRRSAGGGFEEVLVQTGLRGSDGNIEIVEGLEEGESVLAFIKE